MALKIWLKPFSNVEIYQLKEKYIWKEKFNSLCGDDIDNSTKRDSEVKKQAKRFSKECGKEYSYVVRKANERFIPLIRHYATSPISFAAQRELCWHRDVLEAQDSNIACVSRTLSSYEITF